MPPTQVALVYGALGEEDKAFAWLDQSEKAHDFTLMRLKVDSRFESLRSDPRFGELVKRIGLPSSLQQGPSP